MVAFIRQTAQFLNSMDAKAVTSLTVSIILLAFVIVMLLFGERWLDLAEANAHEAALLRAANGPWALVGVISIFCVLALTGFPQILLITAAVVVFGPHLGAAYSWGATMASATLTFGIGHFLGGRWVARIGSDRVQRTIDFLNRHGVFASALIRVVPSAPFVVVNAAAGAAHIALWKFWLGTGIGIIPKILLVAVLSVFTPDAASFSDGISGILGFFESRDPQDFAIIAAIIVAWLSFLLCMRLIYRRMRGREENL